MRKILVISLIWLLAISCEFAHGAEKATVTFQGWIAMEKSGVLPWKIMKEGFEKQYPNIEIKYLGVPFEQMRTQLIISATAGNAPDVSQLVSLWGIELAAFGFLEPLDEYYSKDELKDMYESVVRDGTYKDKLYDVAWAPGPIVLLANKALLKRAGYEPKAPETWTEFTEMVAKIGALGFDEKGNKIFGFGARTDRLPVSGQWFLIPMWAYGGRLVDEKGNTVFASKETIEALNWYKMLAAQKYTPVGMGVREVRNLFALSQVGFIFDGPWMKGILRDISGRGKAIDTEYITAPVPKGRDGKSRSVANHHVLAVFKQSKNKEAALKFIKYLTQNREITEMYHRELGMLAPYISHLTSKEYEDEYTQAFVKQLPGAIAVPHAHPNMSTALDFLTVAAQRAILGQDIVAVAEEADRSLKVLFGK